jgi:hypothetical protein
VAAVVSLQVIVDFIALTGHGWVAYLNRDTGEIISVSDEMRVYVKEEIDPEYLPEWKQRILPKVREALQSASCLPLPDRFRTHELDIMEQFAYRQADLGLRSELLESTRGLSPVRGFRSLIYEHDLDKPWQEFQQAALEQIARHWLELHEIAYR